MPRPPRPVIERLRTGVPGFDELVAGGIPRGFMVAVVGEPGTGKTVFSIHFAWQGILEGDRVIYVTTEESRDSIIKQAAMFGMDFALAVDEGRMIIIDALMRGRGDEWSLEARETASISGARATRAPPPEIAFSMRAAALRLLPGLARRGSYS